ncbi:SDR family oxidoreductase [Bacillus sp. FJAT-53711]|uniref:SDR family oxidoreductase n=1 Tax=Bacillus yunxiaonensis TaxID=3127665 RepID=A0ABU8FPJ9_9BACI
MNICLFGATGRVGVGILKFALQDNHKVTALVRNKEKLQIQHENFRVIEGNVWNEEDVRECVKGADVVISALGTDGNGTLSKSLPNIIDAMNEEGIIRVITIGTAGILQARVNPQLYRFQSSESRRKTTAAAEDHVAAYLALENSKLQWTIVCPTHLIDGEETATYRTEEDVLPLGGVKITVGDTAHFAYQLLYHDIHYKKRVGIAY